MAKIKLGTPPKNIPHTVKFKGIDGEEDTFDVTYKYRTRSQFAQYVDSLSTAATKKAKAQAKASTSKKAKKPAAEALEGDEVLDVTVWTDIVNGTSGQMAEHLMGMLESWELNDELNRANVERLVDEYPGLATAIISDYRAAVVEGRLGN